MKTKWFERAWEIAGQRGLKDKDLRELTAESSGNISKYKRGTICSDSIEVAVKFATALKVPPEYLIFGVEKPDPVHNLIVHVQSQANKDKINGISDDYLGIPLYESGRLAAGTNGTEFDPHEEPASMVMVYKPELQGRSKHTLAAIKVGGDSMDPTITRDSIVVLDLSDRYQVENKIFVVNTPEGGMDMASIKRVQRFDKGFLLLSDNREFPPVFSPLDWNRLCVGRVVWMWRDISNI